MDVQPAESGHGVKLALALTSGTFSLGNVLWTVGHLGLDKTIWPAGVGFLLGIVAVLVGGSGQRSRGGIAGAIALAISLLAGLIALGMSSGPYPFG